MRGIGIRGWLQEASIRWAGLGRFGLVAEEHAWRQGDLLEVARRPSGDLALLVGGLNTVGQAHLWAQAARTLPGVGGASLGWIRPDANRFFVDAAPSMNAVRHSPLWSARQSAEILGPGGFTHVVIESAQPIMGKLYRRSVEAEVAAMQERGVVPALVWHGSDIRNPEQHRETVRSSPFFGSLGGLTDKLARLTAQNARLADRLGLPEFVSTPDLLDYRPNATWLPTLHDRSRWRGRVQARDAARPVVVHIPSRAALKGSAAIADAMNRIGGLIEYRQLSALTPDEVAEQVRRADIVIDQVGMGLYGVTSIEAMSIGKPVVAEVGASVRRRIPVHLPIVEATASSVADAVTSLARDADLRESLGAAGVRYVGAMHSAARVAATLDRGLLQVN